MKIVDVEAYPVAEPVPAPYRWRDGIPGSPEQYDVTWIRVVTDEGVDGYSYIERNAIGVDLVNRCLKPLLVGEDPLQKELLWHKVWELDRIEELPIYAIGAADIALWDITAKLSGLPLCRVLGGYADAIPAYASTVTYASVEEFLDVADQFLEHGFRAIKLHAWGDARRDAELCVALRSHVGDDIALMYDATAAFNPYDALFVGRACESAGYRWYEEPLREFNISAYRRLCDALDIPVLAPETADGCHHIAAEFIVAGAADMVRTGVDFRGITGALRVAHVADAFQMTAEVHGGGLANLHLGAAIPNNTYYECLVYTNPIVVEPRVGHDGMVQVPQGPGIGYDLDPEALAAGHGPGRPEG
jgi:L-alanine-DL-glutamate epimerase-like enolase superfamily enzyme